MLKSKILVSIVGCLICLLVVCSCNSVESSDLAAVPSDVVNSTGTTKPTEAEPNKCMGETFYNSLEDFLTAVSEGKEELFCAANSDYYYQPTNLPKEYKLSKISVLPMYLTFEYKIDPKDELEVSLMYRWVYTGFTNGNEKAIDEFVAKGAQRISVITKNDLKVYSKYDYEKELTKSEKASGLAWPCAYLQDGEYFKASIPWNVNPEKLGEALEMTKISMK